ncbi:hypothetical protein Y032_0003g1403 [Ancylostoma ceylanicum]|uniref:Uncharacterized protein n=1 Tax=Ancylostoma ceylanicum TaxID=53326 RepID=A0A016VZE0_9BILA|nr:hypothetical protein Y032_0003g1403 [Ancylostoma ceylanicum]
MPDFWSTKNSFGPIANCCDIYGRVKLCDYCPRTVTITGFCWFYQLCEAIVISHTNFSQCPNPCRALELFSDVLLCRCFSLILCLDAIDSSSRPAK